MSSSIRRNAKDSPRLSSGWIFWIFRLHNPVFSYLYLYWDFVSDFVIQFLCLQLDHEKCQRQSPSQFRLYFLYLSLFFFVAVFVLESVFVIKTLCLQLNQDIYQHLAEEMGHIWLSV